MNQAHISTTPTTPTSPHPLHLAVNEATFEPELFSRPMNTEEDDGLTGAERIEKMINRRVGLELIPIRYLQVPTVGTTISPYKKRSRPGLYSDMQNISGPNLCNSR